MGILRTVTLTAAALAGYRALVRGDLTLDLGVGRRTRPLVCPPVDIEASREVVFDVIAQPYLGRMTRAQRDKIDVVERGSDMVLAAHRTPVSGGLVTTTLETVRFERPERIHFRLVRGPVPFVVEQFVLTETGTGTRLEYAGEMGTDLWGLGDWWGDRVAPPWEAAVQAAFASVKTEAERLSGLPPRG